MVRGIQQLRDRYDAILLDLDGTLLDGRSQVTPRTVRAVKALEKAGFTVILCTGRSLPGTRRVHKDLGLTTPVAAYNGCWIGRLEEAPWRYAPIPDHAAAHVLETEGQASFSFRHRGEHKYTHVKEHDDHVRVADWYENVVRVAHPGELPATDLMRVSLFFDDAGASESAWSAIPAPVREGLHRETFPLSLFPDFRDSHLILCELQRRGKGKAEMYDWLRDEAGIPSERTIAVGDHQNDASMMAGAGLAVAMGNATGEILGLADLVIGHHADEGFAAWVEAGAPSPATPSTGLGAGPSA